MATRARHLACPAAVKLNCISIIIIIIIIIKEMELHHYLVRLALAQLRPKKFMK